MERENSFIWSDNWWIENSVAWFVDGENNVLFCVDLHTNICDFIAEVPSPSNSKFRLNPRCIKCGNDIFCIPDIGSEIWVYHLCTLQFYKIGVNNPHNERLLIANFWRCNNRIFAVSIGLKQVIEIDIVEKRIENYYDLTEYPDEKISLSTLVGTSIFCASAVSNHVYEFDLIAKNIIVHTIPNIKGGLQTICYDGEKFWLSGYYKEIWVWNKESNTVKIIDRFPKQFGIYNVKEDGKLLLDCDKTLYDTVTFVDSIAIGKDVWFLPFQTNKIVYVNKDTFEINIFEVENEDEKSFLGRGLAYKYLLEYVLDNRYIGIFSLKNNCILEIDSVKKKSEKKDCIFSKTCLQKMMQAYNKCQKIFLEGNCFDEVVFEYQLMLIDKKEIENQ